MRACHKMHACGLVWSAGNTLYCVNCGQANTPFSHFQVVDLRLQIAQGMEYIYTKMGMAHRDLKSH